jgi:hypothetical protein
MAVRLWIVGEGINELGRHDGHGGRGRGVIEALLQKMCATGWTCVQKVQWNAIRRYRAGGARGRGSDHADYWNVLSLVLAAYEAGCEVVAFSRDVDSDPHREPAVMAALGWVAKESGWVIDVVGGVARPAVEGWILALRGTRDTDSMSRQRTLDGLAAMAIDAKSTTQYLEVIDAAILEAPATFGLPPGTESLQVWLSSAHGVLTRLVHGTQR